MFLLETIISYRFSLFSDSFFIGNQCLSQAKSMFLLNVSIFSSFVASGLSSEGIWVRDRTPKLEAVDKNIDFAWEMHWVPSRVFDSSRELIAGNTFYVATIPSTVVSDAYFACFCAACSQTNVGKPQEKYWHTTRVCGWRSELFRLCGVCAIAQYLRKHSKPKVKRQ